MPRVIPKLFLRIAIVLFALQHSAPSRARTPRKACTGIDMVAAVPSQPFSAEYVWWATGSSETTETVARDSEGRIRIDPHSSPVQHGSLHYMMYFRSADENAKFRSWTLVAFTDVFDCDAGTMLRLQNETHLARLVRLGVSPGSTDGVAFSQSFFPGSGATIPPNMRVEQLGNREIQGLAATGVKLTVLGTEEDKEWDGKPISEMELWTSEKLSLQLSRITRNFHDGTQSQLELKTIRRVEPDATLFELPADYKMDPTEMEIFELRPGVSLISQMGPDHRACQTAWQPTENVIHGGQVAYFDSDTTDEILEQVAPPATRGKELPGGSHQTSRCNGGYFVEYENVRWEKQFHCSGGSWGNTISVSFKRDVCPAHNWQTEEHSFGILRKDQ